MIPGFGIIRRLMFTAILLLGALVGGSLYLEGQAERRLAGVVQERFDLSSEPTIDIGGGLLLLNVFQKRLPSLSIASRSAKVDKVPIEGFTATLKDLTLDGSILDPAALKVTVGEGTVGATVTERAVNDLLDRKGVDSTIDLTAERVRVRATRTIGGKRRKLVATGTLSVKGSTLRFTPKSVTVDGEKASDASLERAKKETTVAVKLPKLPGGFTVDSLKAQDGSLGVVARLDGEQISLDT